MQVNNIFNQNTVSYRDKFTVNSNAGVLSFEEITNNISSTPTVAQVETQSKELVMPTSSAILKSEVLPNPYGDSLYNVTTTTSVNGNILQLINI